MHSGCKHHSRRLPENRWTKSAGPNSDIATSVGGRVRPVISAGGQFGTVLGSDSSPQQRSAAQYAPAATVADGRRAGVAATAPGDNEIGRGVEL